MMNLLGAALDVDLDKEFGARGGWPLHELPEEGVLAVIWQGGGRGSLDA